jgi:hypothetical protein
MEIDINYDSFNKHYNKGSNITGTINISCSERLIEFTHMNLILTVSYIFNF